MQVTAAGRRAGPVSGHNVRAMTASRYLLPSALTLVGVPTVLALTGGTINGAVTAGLSVTLAVLTLFAYRWPLTVVILEALLVAGFRAADLIGSGWLWPATAAFVVLVLGGRLRSAVIVAVVGLLYGFCWDQFVNLDHSGDWALGHVGGEALWLAAALAGAQAYRNTRRWQDEVAGRIEQDRHEKELEAGRRRAEERVDIARDLHDAVSHTLAVVGVHLNVALDAFDTDPDEARRTWC
jgi:signal transduction histidine kinase